MKIKTLGSIIALICFGVFLQFAIAQTTPPNATTPPEHVKSVTKVEVSPGQMRTMEQLADTEKERDQLKTQFAETSRQVNAANQIVALLQQQRAYWQKQASDYEIQLNLAQTSVSDLQKEVVALKQAAAAKVEPKAPDKK